MKLRKLVAINYNHHNGSWLLDPYRPPMPPVLPTGVASDKSPALAKSQLTVKLERPNIPGWVVPVKGKRASAHPLQPQLPTEISFGYV